MHTFLGNNSAIGACLALGAAIGERETSSHAEKQPFAALSLRLII
jgi:hypothetical protein